VVTLGDIITRLELNDLAASVTTVGAGARWKHHIETTKRKFTLTTDAYFHTNIEKVNDFVKLLTKFEDIKAGSKKAIAREVMEHFLRDCGEETVYDNGLSDSAISMLKCGLVRKLFPSQDVDDQGNLIYGFCDCSGEPPKKYLIRSDGKYIDQEHAEMYNYTLRDMMVKEPRWDPEDILNFLTENKQEFDPAELYQKIRSLYVHFLDLPDEAIYDILTLWALGTYVFCRFTTYPYIHVTGAHGTGKSKVLSVTNCISFNAASTGNCTPSAIFRVVEGIRATIILDEAEVLQDSMNNKKGYNERAQEISLLLKDGFSITGNVSRVEKDGKDRQTVREFKSYSPKMLGSINELDPVLESRCITIVMQPAKFGDPRDDRHPENYDPKLLQHIRNQCYRYGLWSASSDFNKIWGIIRKTKKKELREINSRNRDIMRPLLVVAYTINEELVDKILKYGNLLVKEKKIDTSDSVEAFAAKIIIGMFNMERKPVIRLTFKDIALELNNKCNNEWGSHNINFGSRSVGKLVKKLGIKKVKAKNNVTAALIDINVVNTLKDRFRRYFDESELGGVGGRYGGFCLTILTDNLFSNIYTHKEDKECMQFAKNFLDSLGGDFISLSPPMSKNLDQTILDIVTQHNEIGLSDLFKITGELGFEPSLVEPLVNELMTKGALFMPRTGVLMRLD